MFRNNSDSSQVAELSWEEDLPLTQDQLALIDGTQDQLALIHGTQEQLEVSCNNINVPNISTGSFRSSPSRIFGSRTPKKSNRQTEQQHLSEENKEFMSWSREMLISKIKALQQDLFSNSGMLVMKEDEHRREKDRLMDEQKRLRSELSTVSSEFARTTESLRTQLVFQTKECDEAQTQLRRMQDERVSMKAEVLVSQQSRSPGRERPLSPVMVGENVARSPNGFPTSQSFLANSSPIKTPRRSRRPVKGQQKRVSETSTSPFKSPPAKRFAMQTSNQCASPAMVLDSPHVKSWLLEDSHSRARLKQESSDQDSHRPLGAPLLVRVLDEHHARIQREDGHHRYERELARKLVCLQNEMVAEKVDFDVLPQLKTYEKHLEISHPLSLATEENFTLFNSCFHRFVSSSLDGDDQQLSIGDKGEDEDDLEKSLLGDEIREWHLVLRMLPCLANHLRLFANELLRRRVFVDSIDGDLTRAANSSERTCSLTGTGPMDEFFDVVRELGWSADDVYDCPHVLPSRNLSIFRKQVSFSLRWLLVIHQFCSRLRPWIHGEAVELLPTDGEIPANVIRLLSNLRFYSEDELPIKRGALDLFADICRDMKEETKVEALRDVKPFYLLLMSSDERILSTLHCFEAMRYLVTVPSFREDFNFHRGRRQCLWAVVFHIVNKIDRSAWDNKTYCFLIIQFASFAIAAVRANMLKVDRSCSCYRGMYEALASAALSQAQQMFDNSWNSFVIEAVERPLRALLFLLQSQGVESFEEITSNMYPLFALISMLKRIETCRHYNLEMKAAMDVQLINEFDDIDDEFLIGE